jgi:hypothetical protein
MTSSPPSFSPLLHGCIARTVKCGGMAGVYLVIIPRLRLMDPQIPPRSRRDGLQRALHGLPRKRQCPREGNRVR